jgi:hypothetical protein
MNAVAFCLYGEEKRYLTGALHNAEQMLIHYPGWRAFFWADATVPGHITERLKRLKAVVLPIPLMFRNKMLARLLIHDMPRVERYVVRDVDSRFSVRETRAVREWISAGTRLHIMRDHPYHQQPIMGGMWGWKKAPGDFQMLARIKLWFRKPMRPGEDQDFLRENVYPLPVDRTVHDSCGTCDGTQNWPPDGPGFVGEYISETGQHNEQHRKMRSDFLARHELLEKNEASFSPPPMSKNNTLYLLPHLGLGDAIICNGMIRSLASRHDRLVLPCKWHNRSSVSWMLKDFENIRILGVKNDAEAILWADRFESGGSTVLRLGSHSREKLDARWDQQFYIQAGVPFEQRWEGFVLPGVTPTIPNGHVTPSFAHEDIIRGFRINRQLLPRDVRFVQRMKTIFEAIDWLADAPEIHCIDSSFLCLADSVPTRGRLVLHAYATVKDKPTGPPILRKPWEVLT